jgi:hypothetical protein
MYAFELPHNPTRAQLYDFVKNVNLVVGYHAVSIAPSFIDVLSADELADLRARFSGREMSTNMILHALRPLQPASHADSIRTGRQLSREFASVKRGPFSFYLIP